MYTPIPAHAFWGKAAFDPTTGALASWHPLADHCLDVAAVFRALIALPTVQARLGQAAVQPLDEVQIDRLAVLALLHDLGKCNLGFQNKILYPNAPRAGHVRELTPLFGESALQERLAEALAIDTLFGWFDTPETLQALLIAAWSHHGKPMSFDPSDRTGNYHFACRWWQPDQQRDPFQAVTELLAVAKSAFPCAFQPRGAVIVGHPRLQHRYAGLVMLADWIGSHTDFFPYREHAGEDRLLLAKTQASEALQRIGIDSRTAQTDLMARPAVFVDRFGFSPRPLQQTIAELPVDDAATRLLIAEAETGSGKTEAALARFFALFAAGQVDALYFALPTRVAARELYCRVCHYIARVFPDETSRPAVLLAVPGYAQVNGVAPETILPPENVRWQDDETQRLREKIWAAERPKRFLAATIAVGTLDQALLSALQTPHAHLRSVCLDRSLLVVDEVHSSDPYMRRLLTLLLQHHLGLGGHALLLSATLGAAARTGFLAAADTSPEPPDYQTACAVPYPSLIDYEGRQHRLAAGSSAPDKRVQVELKPWLADPTALLPELRQALASGARVLAIFNTVDRALTLQRAVEACPDLQPALFRCEGIIAPHHGRFAPADRAVLDRAVSARLGKDSPAGPLLLIGTQTLEQSLDIDADLLLTDLCPLDILLQRIGRLHRHQRQRPAAYTQARCLVLTPLETDFTVLLDAKGAAVGAAKKNGLGSVYPDLRALQLTRDVLAQQPELSIPADNRRLVESITHPERLATLTGDRWALHRQAVDGIALAQSLGAQSVALADLLSRSFGEFSFNDKLSGEVRTRLGLDTLRIPLPQPVVSPYGQQLSDIVIPGRWVPKPLDTEQANLLSADPATLVLALGKRRYRYTRLGLEMMDDDESAD